MIVQIKVEFGHTYEEYKEVVKNHSNENDSLWDFPAEEVFNGAVEPREDIGYWLIEDRLYEVPLSAMKQGDIYGSSY